VGTPPVSDLVTRARNGDAGAWDDLVDRHLGTVHAICRGHHLRPEDAAEVNEAVWLRLVETLDRLRVAEAVGGWIAATTRNECLRVLRARGRAVPTRDGVVVDAAASASGASGGDVPVGVDTGLLVYERDRHLMTAFARLGDRCQQLLRLVMADPAPGDDEIAAALDMPVGSIAPLRHGCLDELRHHVDTR
jgi:RNA polymerase sigma factor (sigma-70 family)